MISEQAGLVLGEAVMRECLGRGRGQRAKTLRRTVDDRDWNFGGDAPPVLPAMELREIVSAHDPDQAQAGSAAAQICNRVERIAGSDDSFETTDIDARIVGHLTRRFGVFVEIEPGIDCPHGSTVHLANPDQTHRAIARQTWRSQQEIDWVTAFVRALSCFLSLAPAGIGFLWIAFDSEKQAWHDKIAGTVVVRTRKRLSPV